jgi:RNA polymerase sigma-70 factor (ECF subfamily)
MWQPGTRLDSWMFQIAHNLNMNNAWTRRVRARHFRSVEADAIAAADGHRIVENRMTLEAVRAFIEQLPEDQRAVLLLVCIEGCSYRDVSEILEVPVGTVTSRLARARVALRDMVDGINVSEGPMRPLPRERAVVDATGPSP